MFLEKWWPRFPVLVFFLNCLMSPKKKWRMTEHYKHTILETCMGIDDPYVKKPRWRRKWNAISKMIKNGLAEGMVTRKLCVEVLDLVLTSFQTSFFQHQPSQKSKSLTCCYLVPRFSVTPYLVPIGKVDLKKTCFHPQAIPFFSKQRRLLI